MISPELAAEIKALRKFIKEERAYVRNKWKTHRLLFFKKSKVRDRRDALLIAEERWMQIQYDLNIFKDETANIAYLLAGGDWI